MLFSSDQEIDELFLHHYSHYPHYKEIQEAIWEVFKNQAHLWFSDIKTMSANLSLSVAAVRDYISLITESDDKPQLLDQLFFQVDENGQLKLIKLSPEDLFVLTLATLETTNTKINNKLAQKANPEQEAAKNDWLKSMFTCWQPVGKPHKPTLDPVFNNPSNSLWAILQKY